MPRKQHNYHFIYKTTCIITNKYYVGMHSTSNMNDGYLGSGKKLWNSIRKYGQKNHKIEYLEFFHDRESLNLREAELIDENLLNDPLCMNLILGGSNPILYGNANGMFGKNITLEHIEKMKNGRNEKLKNPIFLENFKSKIKEGIHKKFGDKGNQSFLNKNHSTETKEKMSECAKLRVKEKNSQFGTCWIIKNGESKKIKKEELQFYIDSGWNKGRKM